MIWYVLPRLHRWTAHKRQTGGRSRTGYIANKDDDATCSWGSFCFFRWSKNEDNHSHASSGTLKIELCLQPQSTEGAHAPSLVDVDKHFGLELFLDHLATKFVRNEDFRYLKFKMQLIQSNLIMVIIRLARNKMKPSHSVAKMYYFLLLVSSGLGSSSRCDSKLTTETKTEDKSLLYGLIAIPIVILYCIVTQSKWFKGKFLVQVPCAHSVL